MVGLNFSKTIIKRLLNFETIKLIFNIIWWCWIFPNPLFIMRSFNPHTANDRNASRWVGAAELPNDGIFPCSALLGKSHTVCIFSDEKISFRPDPCKCGKPFSFLGNSLAETYFSCNILIFQLHGYVSPHLRGNIEVLFFFFS